MMFGLQRHQRRHPKVGLELIRKEPDIHKIKQTRVCYIVRTIKTDENGQQQDLY